MEIGKIYNTSPTLKQYAASDCVVKKKKLKYLTARGTKLS